MFIAWIKGEIVMVRRGGVEETVNRGEIAQHVLTLAERNFYTVYTSTLTLAEAHKPRHYDPLAPELNQKLLDYFENDFIELITVDREVAIEANRLATMYALNPNDAIHVACAIRAECDVLLVWDDRFVNKNGIIPGIRIEEPQKIGQQMLNLDGSES